MLKKPASPQTPAPRAMPSATVIAVGRPFVRDVRMTTKKFGPGAATAADHSRAMLSRIGSASIMNFDYGFTPPSRKLRTNSHRRLFPKSE